jgi:hypothetical protein
MDAEGVREGVWLTRCFGEAVGLLLSLRSCACFLCGRWILTVGL